MEDIKVIKEAIERSISSHLPKEKKRTSRIYSLTHGTSFLYRKRKKTECVKKWMTMTISNRKGGSYAKMVQEKT